MHPGSQGVTEDGRPRQILALEERVAELYVVAHATNRVGAGRPFRVDQASADVARALPPVAPGSASRAEPGTTLARSASSRFRGALARDPVDPGNPALEGWQGPRPE